MGYQLSPADRALALRCWPNTVPFEDIGNRLLAEGIAHFAQLTDDFAIAQSAFSRANWTTKASIAWLVLGRPLGLAV